VSYIRDLEQSIENELESFIYDVIENRRPYRVGEFFAKAAEIIEDTVKRRLGKDVRCDKKLLDIRGDQWARLFVECAIPGKPWKLVIRTPMEVKFKLPEGAIADYTDIHVDEVVVFER